MIRRRTITSYVWNSVSGNKMVILSNCIRNFFRKFELSGNSTQGENPSPDNPQEIKSAGRFDEASGKYLLDVKVTGKNLFNVDKAKDSNNWIDSTVQSGYVDFRIYVGKGKSVNISYSENLEAGLGFYAGIAQSANSSMSYWLYHSSQNSLNKNNYKIVAQYDYIILRIIKSKLQLFFNHIKTLQIEISDKPTSYEPYTEQTVQIALDEPLRGIGEYKDTIIKDGVVRKTVREVGNIDCEFYDFDADKNFYKIVFTPKYAPKNDKYYTIQCNISPHMVIYEGNPLIYWLPTTEEIKGMGIDIKGTMEDANTKLLEYLSKNPIELQYGIKTPVTEPLPESVQAQLQALHSENGVTHVFVDSGEVEAGINIEYKYKS